MRFEVLTVKLLRNHNFWNMSLCHWVSGSQHLKGCSHSPRPLTVNSGMSGTIHPTLQHRIPEDMNPQSVSGQFDIKHNQCLQFHINWQLVPSNLICYSNQWLGMMKCIIMSQSSTTIASSIYILCHLYYRRKTGEQHWYERNRCQRKVLRNTNKHSNSTYCQWWRCTEGRQNVWSEM